MIMLLALFCWFVFFVLSIRKSCFAVLCSDGQFTLKPFCYKICPKTYYGLTTSVQVPSSSDLSVKQFRNASFCEPCHLTCLHCEGPLESQCSECIARHRLTYEHRCVEIPFGEPEEHGHSSTTIVLFVIPIMSCVLILILALFALVISRRYHPDLGRSISRDGRIMDSGEQMLLLKENEQTEHEWMRPPCLFSLLHVGKSARKDFIIFASSEFCYFD